MSIIKNNINLIFRCHRLLSTHNKNDKKNIILSSTQLNTAIKDLIAAKKYKQALDLFDEKFEICNDYTISMAINACSLINDYNRGIRIQKQLQSNSLKNNYIQTSLIRFYSQYHDMDNAIRLFSTITNKSSYICTAMFKGLKNNNMPEKVFDLLDQMTFKPDNYTLTILFNVCAQVANDRAMKIGRKLLDEMPDDYRNNNIVLNSAIDMLMKFGDVQSAERIFDSIKKKDIITYSAMIKGYIGNEMSEKALDLFEKIDLKLDDVTYIIVFNACAKLANDRAMKIGKKLLDNMPNDYRNNNILLNSAIDMLMKFGDVQSAERIFDSIKKKNIISYGALMNGYNINSKPWKCFKILEEMKQQGVVLDEHACNILIGTCSKIGMIRECQYIIDQIPLHIQNLKQIQ
ncbi:unnamed protein product, partial [Rotaria sordida]